MDILSLKQTEDHEGVDPSDLSFGFRQWWPKTGSISLQGGRRRRIQPRCHKSAYFNEQKQCFLHAFSFTDSVRPATGRASYIRTLRTLTPPPGVATNQRPKTENRKLITEDRRLQTFETYFKTIKGRKRPKRSVGRQNKRNRHGLRCSKMTVLRLKILKLRGKPSWNI